MNEVPLIPSLTLKRLQVELKKNELLEFILFIHFRVVGCPVYWQHSIMILNYDVYPVYPTPSLALPQISLCVYSLLLCASLSRPSGLLLPLVYFLCVSSYTSLDFEN